MFRQIVIKLEKKGILEKIIKVSAFFWIASIIGFLINLGYVVGIRKELYNETSNIFAYIQLAFFLVGSLGFIIGIIALTFKLAINQFEKKQNFIIFIIKLFFIFALLPIYFFLKIIEPLGLIKTLKKSGLRGFNLKKMLNKSILLTLNSFIILPVWIIGYLVIALIIIEATGYNPHPIPIAGTGSMYPTFPKGVGKDAKELSRQIVGTPGMIPYPNGLYIFGKRFFSYQLGRGDIVVIENEKIRKITEEVYGTPSGWVKRVIALEGDTIELRGGIVYLNHQPLKEPYTAKPQSTFGESFLKECHPVVVPKNHIFVMGDNRKESGDSREIGFIEISAVRYVLPLKDQKGDLKKYWRDTTKDFDQSSKIKLDKEKYLELLNNKRKEVGVRPLRYQPKLELSAIKRGEIMIKFNDFSFEATRSGYTMEKAMNEVNYYNIVWGEAPTQGYFEAEELIENQFSFPQAKKFLLNKDFQEIGIAEVEGEINNCPTQVIVQHFAGYVPPNYSRDLIDSWKTVLKRLKEIQPGWEKLKDYQEFYQRNKADVDRINEIISIRIANISQIVARMEANQWLTNEEKKMIEEDHSLGEEQQRLAEKLNSQSM